MTNPRVSRPWGHVNSGDRIRTCDLRVMSPTSYQTALPRNRAAEYTKRSSMARSKVDRCV